VALRGRTGCQERLAGTLEAHQLGQRRPEDVEVEDADPWSSAARGLVRQRRKSECEVDCSGEHGHQLARSAGQCARSRGADDPDDEVDLVEGGEDAPATLLLPTPPLPLETTTTFLTPSSLRFCGNPRCIRGMVGGASLRGRPCARGSIVRQSLTRCGRGTRQLTRGLSWLRGAEVEANERAAEPDEGAMLRGRQVQAELY